MTDRDPQTASWHIDKRVPIVLVVTMVIGFLAQTAGFSFWVGRISSQNDHNTAWIKENTSLPVHVAVLQSQLADILKSLGRIEGQIGPNRYPNSGYMDARPDKQ